jgi:hypothetical protein
MMCCGFWVGIFISIIFSYSPFIDLYYYGVYSDESFTLTTTGMVVFTIADGLSSAGIIWIINAIVENLLAKTDL